MATPLQSLRVDGGMSANEVFVTALAEAIGRPVEVSPVLEATTLGAGLLAGLAVGTYALDRRAGADLHAAPHGAPVRQHVGSGRRPRALAGGAGQGRGDDPGVLGISF